MKIIVFLKCIRKSQRKRGHEGSEQEEETIQVFPKSTARRKIFTLNEELNAIVCTIRGQRVEQVNALRCDDCKKCVMTKTYQNIIRIIFQVPKMTLLAVIPASMKTLQTTA